MNRWTARLARVATLASLLAAPACHLQSIAGSEFEDGGDAGVDAGAQDSGIDAGVDAGADAAFDGGLDAGLDGGGDGGDAGVGTPDAGFGACGPGSELTSYMSSVPVSLTSIARSGDVNGDGLLDLVIGGSSDGGYYDDQVYIALGQPGGGLGSLQSYPFSNLTSLAVGDLNGDGLADVVVATGSKLVAVYLSQGDAGLVPDARYSVTSWVGGIAIGDVDGDGLADIVVGEESSEIFYGAGGGQFTGPFPLPRVVASLDWGGIEVGDLNGDGRADIIGDDAYGLHLVVLLSQGRGNFKVTTYPTRALGQIALIAGPSGKPDLVLGEWGAATYDILSGAGVAVMTNAGDGTFGPARSYTVPGGSSLAIGDFNGDCIPDIASTTANNYQRNWPISILYGDGDGGYFGPELIAAADPCPRTLNVLGSVANPSALTTTDFCDAGVIIYGESSGTSTGKTSIPVSVPIVPLFLLDAGLGTVFGPVSIAAMAEPKGGGVAKLGFAMGDGGNYTIMLLTLGADGGVVGAPVNVAITGVDLLPSDAGPQIGYPSAPPVVTVADDGEQTAVCWEDYGLGANRQPVIDCTYGGRIVRCGAASEDETLLDAGYFNCGAEPQLVFNPIDGAMQLFFQESLGGWSEDEWAFGQSPGISQIVDTKGQRGIAVSIDRGMEGTVLTETSEVGGGVDVSGLLVAQAPYAQETYQLPRLSSIDTQYQAGDREPAPFAAAGSLAAHTIGVLLDDAAQIEEFTVRIESDGGVVLGTPMVILSAEPLIGALAVGVCAGGFDFIATTADDAVFIARGNFDGTLVADGGRYFDLVHFNQTPALFRFDNTDRDVASTSLSVTSVPGGNLLLAISNPAQVGVYAVSCE